MAVSLEGEVEATLLIYRKWTEKGEAKQEQFELPVTLTWIPGGELGVRTRDAGTAWDRGRLREALVMSKRRFRHETYEVYGVKV